MNMQSIMVRRNKVVVEQGQSSLSEVLLATATKNLEALGFMFSPELLTELRTMEDSQFISFYTKLIPILKNAVGAHVEYKPMYPNFPTSVMEAEEAELYLNAIIHYYTNLLPFEEKRERFPLFEKTNLRMLQLASIKDFYQIIRGLISAKTSLSATDQAEVLWSIRNSSDVSTVLPEEIPMKETIAFVVATLLTEGKMNVNEISHYFKTATDVLRLAVALSEGDVSLAGTTKFKKFKRSERRFLLTLLDRMKNPTEDMLKYKGQWIRLGEILHPGEYKNNFQNAYQAFTIIRNNETFPTFSSKVEKALADSNLEEAVRLLSKRPGELARRLDHLLRLSDLPEVVINPFREVASEVSTAVLLQVKTHFQTRNSDQPIRVIFPKGNVAKAVGIENQLPVIPENICLAIVDICEKVLIERFSQLPPLGKVYIEPSLKNMNVPFSQRSASKTLKTLVRGSKFEIPEGNTIRFFTWWKQGANERIDVDLSAMLFDENFLFVDHISYTNLTSTKFRAWHSGDIVDAPNGAAEFIDIDIPSFTQNGGRYIMMQLYTYTEQFYCDMPECFAGWMMRKHPGTGEIFEPRTVENKVDIAAKSRIAIPVILDLVERKVIWCDLSLTNHPQFYNNVEGNLPSTTLMLMSMTSLVKPNLYELFRIHGEARGTLVNEIDDADTIFAMDQGITPFDLEKIMSEFL
ncbi:cytoplasmic protein [Anaerobacillus alkaliphilus]|uniref:Cytoplasmic protein n=1 Tax=Anaerobacillus alkaliphilus TaxID=1548597 RepID=A0A4Q0VNX9_9BACI|nr:cytoplasmic protein [Anaerobacillus alkaliphilus]